MQPAYITIFKILQTFTNLHVYVTDLEAIITIKLTNQTLPVIDSSLLLVLAALSELQHLSPGPVAGGETIYS